MKIGMVFPGYGSQFVGMGKELYDESRVMQEYFEQASQCLDINFVKLCFAASDVELAKMQHAYTSLFLVSSSIAASLKEMGVTPQVVAGYNIGQYAAMHAAGGINFADALYLLNKLSLFSQEVFDQNDQAVARIKGCSFEELQTILKQFEDQSVRIASFEMPNQFVIAGKKEGVDACMQMARELEKVKVEELPIQFGLYGSIMTPAIEQFKIYFEKVDFKDVQLPVIANTTGAPVLTGQELKQEILDYTLRPIMWLQTMQTMHECDMILVMGTGKAQLDMLAQLYPNKEIYAISSPADIALIKQKVDAAQMPEPDVVPEMQTNQILGSEHDGI